MAALEDMVRRNYEESSEWRTEAGKDIKEIKATVTGLTSLVDQAKGAKWLAGLLLTMMGMLSLAGLKTVFGWFYQR